MSVSTEDKRVRWDWDYLQSIAETENLYLLTDRDVQALITPLAVMSWRTRILNAPSDFDLVNTFNATLLESLLTPMDFCALMVDCITNNEGVKIALSLWLSENGSGIPPDGGATPVGTSNPFLSSTNILGASCNDADLAGQCVAIIEYLNQTAQDWIEGMVAFTLPAEIAGYAAQSVPVMNSTGVDFGDIADWIVDEVLTQYTGAYDEALRNDAACLLLAKCCSDCELTLDDILDAFAPEIGVNIDPVTAWSALLADIVTLSVPDEIVYGVWQLICATWKIGAQFLGVSGLNAMAYAASKYDPISPVSIGCDPCGFDPCALPITVNFDDNELPPCAVTWSTQPVTVGSAFGNPVPSVYYSNGNVVGNYNAGVEITLPSGLLTVSIESQHLGYYEGATFGCTWVHQYFDVSGNLLSQQLGQLGVNNAWVTKNTTYTAGVNIAKVRVYSVNTTGATPKDLTVAVDNVVVS